MNAQIENLLIERGADIVRFVDVSALPADKTHGFTKAIVFCVALSKAFVVAVRNGDKIERDEFADKEHETDRLADHLAEYIRRQGYGAYSQSEASLSENGDYDENTLASNLPHKTIARLAGLGFIGNNNLLITEEYGCAFSMCTVLTDAPVVALNPPPVPSKCGSCNICKDICPVHAIHGVPWSVDSGRDGVVDIFRCREDCVFLCAANCPHTLRYALQTTE